MLDAKARIVYQISIGQETAAGKGLAVASSLINTYAAINWTIKKTAAGSPAWCYTKVMLSHKLSQRVLLVLLLVKKIVA